jgi:tRNA(fMet)-specific endonuclease VapC
MPRCVLFQVGLELVGSSSASVRAPQPSVQSHRHRSPTHGRQTQPLQARCATAVSLTDSRAAGVEFIDENSFAPRVLIRVMISLDTNAVIAAINRRVPSVRPRLEAAIAAGEPVGISAIVLFELRYEIIKSARPQENSAILAAFLALDVTPWPFEPKDAEEAGEIRAELERLGKPIGPYDVLIAAQAHPAAQC